MLSGCLGEKTCTDPEGMRLVIEMGMRSIVRRLRKCFVSKMEEGKCVLGEGDEGHRRWIFEGG